MQHTSFSHALPKSIRVVFLAILAAILVVSLCPATSLSPDAYADEISDKQAEAEVALANLNAMQQELDRLSNDYGQALMAQEEAEQKVEAAKKRIEEINKQIQDLQERLSNRAREMYRTGNGTVFDMLLGAQSFVEFATNWDLLNKVNEQDADMVAQRKQLREEGLEQQRILEEQAKIAKENSEAAAAAAAEAEQTVAQMQAIYDGLNAEVYELLEAQRIAEEAAEAARAQAAAAAAAAEAAGAGDGSGNAAGNGNGTTTTNYNPYTDPTPVQQPYEGGSDPVSRAYACLGAPYVWGGTGPYGYDCSGLVGYCLTGSHSRIGTTGTFIGWPQVSDPQPGDVCVIHQAWGSQHTGIYIGGGQMIHAATYGVGVIVGPVQSGMVIVRYPG